MRFDVVSILPELFQGVFSAGVVGQALRHGDLSITVHDLREWAEGERRNVDDQPYGGGAGMVFRPEPLFRAIEALRQPGKRAAVVRTTPRGEPLGQALLRELSGYEQLVLLCDRYEGCDQRVEERLSHEVSLGDFVLTGGELVAMVLVDGVARLVPGVVGRAESLRHDSFSAGLLEHGHFTRPPELAGYQVPEQLVGGNHKKIEDWRRRDALRQSLERRPDLIAALPQAGDWLGLLREERSARIG